MILLIFGSGLYLTSSANPNQLSISSIEIGQQSGVEISASPQSSKVPYIVSTESSKLSTISNSLDNDLLSHDTQTSNGALLSTEEVTTASTIPFIYNETVSDTSNTNLNNDDTFVVSSLEANTATSISGSVNTHLTSSTYNIETDATNESVDFSGTLAYAQGFNVSFFNRSSIAYITSFSVTTSVVLAGNMVGEVWTAKLNGSRIEPKTVVQSKSISVPQSIGDTLQTFTFDTTAEIWANDTYTNSDQDYGYIFFLLYRTPTVSAAILRSEEHRLDEGEEAITYSYTDSSPAQPPSNTSKWVVEDYDLTMSYTASFDLDPTLLDTQVKVNADSTVINVALDRSFFEIKDRFGDTTYQVSYNTGKAATLGITPLIDVSYTNFVDFQNTTQITYTTTPNSANVTWQIQFDSTYTNTSSQVTKYFIVPSNLVLTAYYLNETKLDNISGEYTNSTDNDGNQIIFFEVAHGNYSIYANSTNMLQSADTRAYVDSGGWVEQYNGSMGVLYPVNSEAAGDLVRANIVGAGALGLIGGNVNGSLRTSTGVIPGNQSINAYKDIYNFSETVSYGGTIQFITELDPGIDTGYWSFQFRWFNGTAAGAVAIEFLVLPVGQLDLISPASASIEVIEESIVNIEVHTLDLSHNSNWGNPGTISWDFDSTIDMTANGKPTDFYSYTASIDTDYDNHSTILPNQDYTVTLNFTDGPFSISTSFNVKIYFRASTVLSHSAPIEVNDQLDIDFAPINLTQNGVNPFKNSSVNYVLSTNGVILTPVSGAYDPITGYYNLTIDWSIEFARGSSNQIKLNWTLSAFRNSVAQTYIATSFTFTVNDASAPDLGTPPDPFIYDEGEVGKEIFWQPNDPHPGLYNLTLDSTLPKIRINQVWNNIDGITINVDGLEAGVHSYFIEIFDLDNNTVTNTASVTVFDVTKPNFIAPPNDFFMNEGSTSNFAVWNINDLHLENYTLYEDDIIVESLSSLLDGPQVVNWTIDHLTIGDHNLTLVIFDESDNFDIHTVIVTVIDVTDPVISDESLSQPYEEFSVGHSISWTVSDTNTINYTIYENESPVRTGTASGGIVSIDIDSLPLGSYNYTLVISDTAGNTVFDEVIFNVVDTTSPVITGETTFEYDEGETGNQITWDVSDAHIVKYEVTSDTTISKSETEWLTSDSITLVIDGLSIGEYTITITVTDTSGNFETHTVTLTVKDPQIQETSLVDFEIENFVYEGDVESLSVDGWETDVGGEIVAATVNATLVAIDVAGIDNGTTMQQFSVPTANGQFALQLNYTGLMNGTYAWIFTYEKDLYQTQITDLGSYIVKILPHVLAITISFASTTLTQGEDFSISAKITYADPRNNTGGLGLSTLTPLSGGVPDIEVAFVLTYETTTGSPGSLTANILSDDQGNALWVLAPEVTELIEKLLSVSATITNQIGFDGASSEVTDFELNVKEGSAFFGLIDDIRDFVETNIIIIAAILATILIVVIYFMRVIRKRKQKFTVYAKESEDATVEIDGLRSIHGLIMSAGTTGIPFYEYTFTSARTAIDTALISGISTALSMFLNELDEEKLGFEHMERAGVSITSHKSDLSTMMVISDSPLPPIILEQLEQGHEAVESKFSKQLMIPDRMMDIEPVNITNELVSKSLKLNLKEDIIIRTNNLKKLQKRKSISRKIRNDMGTLAKLAKISEETQEPLNLEMILAYLESQKIDHSSACRVVYLSYVNFIIVPV